MRSASRAVSGSPAAAALAASSRAYSARAEAGAVSSWRKYATHAPAGQPVGRRLTGRRSGGQGRSSAGCGEPRALARGWGVPPLAIARGLAGRPVAAPGSSPSSRSRSTGLVSYSSAPAAMTCSRSSGIAWAVRAITGMARVAASAFSRRVASKPSTTGIFMSIRIRSGFSRTAWRSPRRRMWPRHHLEAARPAGGEQLDVVRSSSTTSRLGHGSSLGHRGRRPSTSPRDCDRPPDRSSPDGSPSAGLRHAAR